MGQSVMDKVAAAKQAVPAISTEEAAKLLDRHDVIFVDVRDAEEVAQSGKIRGALNVSRGMLEFRADEVGRFPFYCSMRADPGCAEMRGELIVR